MNGETIQNLINASITNWESKTQEEKNKYMSRMCEIDKLNKKIHETKLFLERTSRTENPHGYYQATKHLERLERKVQMIYTQIRRENEIH